MRAVIDIVAALSGGWTVLLDDDLAYHLLGDAQIAYMHHRLGARVAAAYASERGEGEDELAFKLWEGGGVRRSVAVSGERVTDDRGGPLPGEGPGAEYGLGDVEFLLNRAGIDIAEGVEVSARCGVQRYAAE